MKLDGILPAPAWSEVGATAARMEQLGFDGLFTSEVTNDPFLPLALAATGTERMDLGTSIAVAFPRSPMHLAQVGRDLQANSGGRFILGLGSQVKAHIERRYSASFDRPAARMREMVLAIRAIWDCWENGTRLDFDGEFFRHTLMTPFFDPGPSGHGPARIFLAAVGPMMTEVAAEVADGMFVHGFSTERNLRERTLPALERGLSRAGRSRADIELSYPLFVITGDDDAEFDTADRAVREQIAFYAATPSYRPVLELHGWGELQTDMQTLAKQGRWKEMGARLPVELVDAFAVRGPVSELPSIISARYGDLIDRVSLYAPYRPEPEQWAGLIAAFREMSHA
ncbi:TIGR03617 family F420-dependent LLM class oxidoreductase [Streptomyces sp. GQFP]|uniref:TIGR03617 family F420-dependent LLM class oxidoreductase n=1 Tax=Streptomyces sp. GQFP TaxID=2907545 RepID=UPI001F46C233|nr:TIGR03617 family F420-dependent LLM class oxidoreductase [Streptomyces sp. GQFP]UIX29367.1 TIGR03617 family F420-dependent LLM class oxidoreductase [Streptomyces sp. GQFP]